jgi:hypothetical protein
LCPDRPRYTASWMVSPRSPCDRGRRTPRAPTRFASGYGVAGGSPTQAVRRRGPILLAGRHGEAGGRGVAHGDVRARRPVLIVVTGGFIVNVAMKMLSSSDGFRVWTSIRVSPSRTNGRRS